MGVGDLSTVRTQVRQVLCDFVSLKYPELQPSAMHWFVNGWLTNGVPVLGRGTTDEVLFRNLVTLCDLLETIKAEIIHAHREQRKQSKRNRAG